MFVPYRVGVGMEQAYARILLVAVGTGSSHALQLLHKEMRCGVPRCLSH